MLKREDLLQKGYSEEQISDLLNLFHTDRQSDLAKMTALETEKNEISSKFQAVNSELQQMKNANLSEQEMIDQKLKEAEEKVRLASEKQKDANKIYNKAKVKEILAEYNLNDELIDTLVTDDEVTTLKNANNWKSAIESMNESVTKKVKEQITNKDVRPTQTNVPQGEDIMTKDKLLKMSLTELKMWKNENHDKYEELMSE